MAINKIQSESINLADNFAFTGTVTGAGEKNTPYFYGHNSGSSQSVANSTWTKVEFTEVLDSDSAFASNTFTPQTAGKYYFSGGCAINGMDAGETTFVSIYKNGSSITGAFGTQVSGGGNIGLQARCDVTVDMNGSSDYVEFFVHHNEGSSQTVWGGAASFTGFLVST